MADDGLPSFSSNACQMSVNPFAHTAYVPLSYGLICSESTSVPDNIDEDRTIY